LKRLSDKQSWFSLKEMSFFASVMHVSILTQNFSCDWLCPLLLLVVCRAVMLVLGTPVNGFRIKGFTSTLMCSLEAHSTLHSYCWLWTVVFTYRDRGNWPITFILGFCWDKWKTREYFCWYRVRVH